MSEIDEREHSKFSASGSERWLNCAASVALEESSPPSKDTPWSKEGTLAHSCLEAELKRKPWPNDFDISDEMVRNVKKAANKIRAIHKVVGGTLMVEQRVYVSFIHPEMFGTCDVIIAGNDGTLHIFDFKNGAGHIVEAKENTQLIEYALGAAESYDWDFDFIKMYILQPRSGENWYKSWLIPIEELKTKWVYLFKKGIKRVLENKSKPMPGSWCHWCRAQKTCPAKQETRAKQVAGLFNNLNEEVQNGQNEKSGEKESQSKKEKSSRAKKVFKDEAESFGFDNDVESFI